jgi:hypothetical protein
VYFVIRLVFNRYAYTVTRKLSVSLCVFVRRFNRVVRNARWRHRTRVQMLTRLQVS